MTLTTRSITKKWLGLAAASTALLLTVSACATNEQPSDPGSSAADTGAVATLSGTLNAGGSSAQTAAQDAWRSGFQAGHSAVTVNYDPVGSGAGRTGFESGAYAVVGTDDAFGTDELASATLSACATKDIVEVPAYISPIALAFNLPNITSLNIDAETAAKLLTGAITKWNDPAIAASNPGVDLPSTAVTPVHRSDKSGTTGNVTDYLSKAAPGAWTYGKTETWPTALKGEAAEKTQGVVQAITSAAGAVGYADASQVSGLGVASLINAGSPVAPTAAAATKTVAASSLQTGRGATDLAFDIARTPSDPTAYPMIMVSYLVGCAQYNDPAVGSLAQAFMSYVVSDAGQQGAASNAGSAPLSVDPDLAAKAQAAVAGIQ